MKKQKILNMGMILSFVFFTLCGVIIVGAIKGWRYSPAQTEMAVSEKKGIVMLERNGVSFELSQGTVVRNGDQFLTTKGATLVIADEKHGKIFLNSDSKIAIKEVEEKILFEILYGEVFIEAKQADSIVAISENQNESEEESVNVQQERPEGLSMSCTIEIVCHTILDNMEDLLPEKEGYVPSDGIVLYETTVTFNEGETVFDVLQRACRNADIPLEYSYAPVYESYYIEGINHLYEFDCGSQSGWMYQVNGCFPNYGCSSYLLEEGDTVVWCYTCNGIGSDVGI